MTKPKYESKRVIYLIGSLRNPQIPVIASALRDENTEVFDNWYSAGETADDSWRDYERGRGHSYQMALTNHSARHIYEFDRFHLNRCHAAVLVLPAGRSGHLEAGFAAGQGKPVFMLLDTEGEPERLDVMTQFMRGGVHPTLGELQTAIVQFRWPKLPPLPMITVIDANWLAGVFEGDGTFCITGKTPRMILQMTDEDTVTRAARILDRGLWQTSQTVTGKKVWASGVAGLVAVEWMRILLPYLSTRRQEQCRQTVMAWLEQRSYRQQDRLWWMRMFNLKDQT